jgi:hypothetical protein
MMPPPSHKYLISASGVNFKSATFVLCPRGSGRVSGPGRLTRVMGHMETCGDGLGGFGGFVSSALFFRSD